MPAGRKKGYKLSDESKEKIRQDNLKNPRKYWLGKKRLTDLTFIDSGNTK